MSASATAHPGSPSDPVQIVLVDDSAVVRGLIGRVLENDAEIKIVASASNGEQGVAAAAKHHPDIVLLDIEMPVMDGITALPKILAASPGTRVVMCSSVSARNAEITLKALSLGATECITKPASSSEIYSEGDFKTEILRVIKALGRKADNASRPADAPAQTSLYAGGLNAPLKSKTAFTLRQHAPEENFRPNLLAIGSSTGGPQALFKLVSHFKDFDAPIVITQHMPATFTKILAQHIQKQTDVETFEAENGMEVEKGKAYVAAGGHHMTFEKTGGKIVIKLDEGPPENFCKPSVDPMLRSAIDIWGAQFLTVILTGMGHDGLDGCKRVTEGGGRVVAQDQETSVVWGMPGAVAIQGLCSAVLPLQEIGPFVRQTFGK